jgi:hypothetical protein
VKTPKVGRTGRFYGRSACQLGNSAREGTEATGHQCWTWNQRGQARTAESKKLVRGLRLSR